jgi:hypothetical protein
MRESYLVRPFLTYLLYVKMITMSKKHNIKSLDQFVNEQYDPKGTLKRDKPEKGYQKFKRRTINQ